MASVPDKNNELSMLDSNDRSMSPDYSQDILYRLTVQLEYFWSFGYRFKWLHDSVASLCTLVEYEDN